MQKILPTSVDILLTLNCDSRCNFCHYWLDKSPNLELKYVLKFIYGLRNLTPKGTQIEILGGEPTLRDDLDIILYICQKLGFKAAITTNGYRLADIDYAKKIVSSGIETITVSLEGFEDENDSMRGAGNFKKTINAIRNIRKLNEKMLITIQSVICSTNYKILPAFLRWVEKEKLADYYSFQALSMDFPNLDLEDKTWWKNNHLWPKDLQELNGILDELIMFKKRSILKVNTKESQFIFWKKYFQNPTQFKKSTNCNFGDFHIMLTSNGDIHLCGLIDEPIGNIRTSTVSELFYSKEADKVRENIHKCEKTCHWHVNCRYDLLQINNHENISDKVNIE